MAQTISEKIFSKACDKKVKAGDFVLANIDCAMTHDITGPLAVEGFREIVKGKKNQTVWDPNKIVILFDHQVPADSPKCRCEPYFPPPVRKRAEHP